MTRQPLPVFDSVSPGDLCRVIIEATVEPSPQKNNTKPRRAT